MSTQEGKLKAIADAIRQKEGTTEPIPADSFASRILALEAGGNKSCRGLLLLDFKKCILSDSHEILDGWT